MKYSLLLFVIFSCIAITANSQTPASKYYKQINLAEKALIEGDLESSVSIYKNTFEKFNYPFSKHIQQGYYVACYAKNKSVAELFLRKSVMNGISKEKFKYYNDLWIRNNSQSIDLKYDSIRIVAMKKIDTTLLFKFLEIDAYKNVLLENLDRNDSLSKVNYFSQMRVLRNNYIELVQSYGYPAENVVGSSCKWKLIKRMRNKYKSCLVHKLPVGKWSETKYKYIVIIDPAERTIPFKPGNWFLTHYINPEDHSVIDSAFFHILKLGFDSLKIDPLIPVNALESTRESSNEFALSYYSRLWAYKLNFDFSKKYALDENVRSIINANRASFYMRSLEQEELLFKSLYKLKFSENISGNISEKEADELKKEVDLFLHIFK